MIKNVIIPLDFSDCSLNALKYGLRIIERLTIEKLYLMHSTIVPVAIGEATFTDTDSDMLETEKFIKERFLDLEKKIPELKKFDHEYLIEKGSVSNALHNISSTTPIDLIIMGTKGASGIQEVIMGTNANAVVQMALAPVLVIPEKAKYQVLDHIALASDYRAIEASTLDMLKILVQKHGSKIHILHTGKTPELSETESDEAKKFELYLKNIQHEYHFIKSNKVKEGVDQYVNENNLKMITVIPRKHNVFQMLYEGDESRKFIYHTDVPVLALSEKLK